MVQDKKKEKKNDAEELEVIEAQECPVCKENVLVLTETEREIPYFGKVYIFSMTCNSCKYHKADVECAEQKEPSKYTFEIESEKDLQVRVVKSSEATVKLPHIGSIEPGASANGYVTNVEGILNRMKQSIENLKESEEDEAAKKKARSMLKKLFRITCGQEKQKIIIEDPTGNSAIISDKAEVSGLKVN